MRRVTDVRLYVAGYPDSDEKERAELAGRLRAELLARDVPDVRHPAGQSPTDAKGTALEWSQLVVALAGSLPALVAVVRGWLDRHPGAEITVEIDDDRITLTVPSRRERRELLDAWMRRHADE
jgi:Effector Associated Constant Component 1